MENTLLLIALTVPAAFCHVVKDMRHVPRTVHDTHVHLSPPHHHLSLSEHGPYVGSCTRGLECVPFVSCPAHIWTIDKVYCTTYVAKRGVCCSTGKNITKPLSGKDIAHQQQHSKTRDADLIALLGHVSRSAMHQLRDQESRLLMFNRSMILTPGSASYNHFRNSRRSGFSDAAEITKLGAKALEISIATKAFKEREGFSNLELEQGILQQFSETTPLGQNCISKPMCPFIEDKYRKIDGSCNNRFNSLWGASRTSYSRLMAPHYHDGIWSPRTSVLEGYNLPSPRLVTTTVFDNKEKANEEYTLLVMQFGQFISHDLSHARDFTYMNGSAISCCKSDGKKSLPVNNPHYACMPINISPHDPFYGRYKQRCMNFVRTTLAPRDDCTLGYSQQMNHVTHFLDGSAIYGSNTEQTERLRSFIGGKLKVFNDYGRDLLPLSTDPDACLTREEGTACFESGDTRTNQMITLVALHTVFMREHNRIAEILSLLNPNWSDEELFLETRRIVVAELQVITYKEFLPIILGGITMEEFDLNLEEGYEYSFGYNPKVDPSVINEFAAAAFRFGHSIVDGVLKIYSQHKMEEMISIPEMMFYPSQMRRTKFLDMVLGSLTTEPMQEVDGSISETLTRYMFRAGNPFGVDLASINVQRGRDHGLRSYNDYRELIGLPRFSSFKDFGTEGGYDLAKIYSTVDDVDLWIGGLLEHRAKGSIVGPAFMNIIAEQFLRLKKGDRYFFENDPSVNPGHFTPEQLFQLRKASMARIICDNSDHILLNRQPLNAFKTKTRVNQFVDCESDNISRVNLRYWSTEE